jgi:enoyl-CoA hydratase/carnithine racemase
MHCDALIAAPSPSGKPYPVGLPEAGLSICPGWGGTNLLPARMDAADAITRTAVGKPLTYDEAVAAKLFDAVAPTPDALLATAKQWVITKRAEGMPPRNGAPSRWIGHLDAKSRVASVLPSLRDSLPHTDSARAVLDAVSAGLTSGWRAALDVERKELVRLRSTPAGKSAIEAFFAKSQK